VTPFMGFARPCGARAVRLGMLVEQAANPFYLAQRAAAEARSLHAADRSTEPGFVNIGRLPAKLVNCSVQPFISRVSRCWKFTMRWSWRTLLLS